MIYLLLGAVVRRLQRNLIDSQTPLHRPVRSTHNITFPCNITVHGRRVVKGYSTIGVLCGTLTSTLGYAQQYTNFPTVMTFMGHKQSDDLMIAYVLWGNVNLSVAIYTIGPIRQQYSPLNITYNT